MDLKSSPGVHRNLINSSLWQSIRSFTVLFKSCIFMVNMNLNKTILQSIYIIFRLFLLFCWSQEVPTTQPKTKTRDGLFLGDLQTINQMLETINHVLEKCEYGNF